MDIVKGILSIVPKSDKDIYNPFNLRWGEKLTYKDIKAYDLDVNNYRENETAQ